jgi:hypothetical protein
MWGVVRCMRRKCALLCDVSRRKCVLPYIVRFNMFIVFLNKYVHYYITRDYARHRPPLVGSVLHKIALRFINQTQMLHYSRERRQRK